MIKAAALARALASTPMRFCFLTSPIGQGLDPIGRAVPLMDLTRRWREMAMGLTVFLVTSRSGLSPCNPIFPDRIARII